MAGEGHADEVVAALLQERPGLALERAVALPEGERAAVLDALAGAAATGDERAIELLLAVVDRLRLVHPVVHRFVVNRADADDVAQDVLLSVARSIGAFRRDARFTTWLFAVARNCSIAYVRRLKHTDALEGDDAASSSVRLSSVIATRTSLRDAIASLPDEYRQPVVLRDVERLSYQDVADRLALNLNTTKSRIARGRALLSRQLEGDDG